MIQSYPKKFKPIRTDCYTKLRMLDASIKKKTIERQKNDH